MSETQNKTQDVKMSPEMATAHKKMIAAADEVEKVVVGKRTEVLHLLTAMLAGAHVLIEDVPGTGKTTLFRMIMGLETPDGGTFEVGETVKLAYVDQQHKSIDPEKSVYEVISQNSDLITWIFETQSTSLFSLKI